MKSDGKRLEKLVAFVEKEMLPKGFEVRSNQRVYDDDGNPLAEFDIEIRGKIGSTNFAWLIECRDRPSAGRAPGEWIEQLVGRRERFNFNKVTAVSTTGFPEGIFKFANDKGIELREVKELSAEEFADWLPIRNIDLNVRGTEVSHAEIIIDKGETRERQEALSQVITGISAKTDFLRDMKNGEKVSPIVAFYRAVLSVNNGGLFDGLEPNGPQKAITLKQEFQEDAYFVVDTACGPVRVKAIVFKGELFLRKIVLPLEGSVTYRDAATEDVISLAAAFASPTISGISYSFDLHIIPSKEKAVFSIRKTEQGR